MGEVTVFVFAGIVRKDGVVIFGFVWNGDDHLGLMD